jgi:ribonuclease HI
LDVLASQSIERWILPVYYVDGGSQGNEQKNRPRSAKIAIAYSEDSDRIDPSKIEIMWGTVGDKTNNEAEYLALLKALQLISERLADKSGYGGEKVLIRSDSKLIVNQVKGEFHVKEPRLKDMSERAKDAIQKLGSVQLEWVPRRENYAGMWIEGVLRPLSVHRLLS